jgi:hypothetical protein
MGEIVQREKRGVIVVLPLPGGRPIGSDAAEESTTITPLGELENEHQGAAVYKLPKS